MTRSTTTPMLVPVEGPPRTLEKLILGSGTFSEDWLQARIAEHPSLLPVAEIEPGFGTLVSIAREVPCASGYIDNVYVTASGDIVLVETKLWANAEARRKVVTQTLDYIAALMRMDYAGFETAVMRSSHPPYEPGLHDSVMREPDALDQPRFVDAVSRNLRRGRILALIVDDGIREEAQALAAVVQGHAGAHFTLALVAIGVWRDTETGALLLVPDVLAKTAMIERGIVRVVDGAVSVEAVPPEQAQATPQSITEQDYYAALGLIDPALPRQLQAFLERLAPYGVTPEVRRTLILRAEVAGAARPISFGYIDSHGKYWSGDLVASAGTEIARAYAQEVADLIGGRVGAKGGVTTNGTSAPAITQLLPDHAERWEAAIARTIAAIAEGTPDAEPFSIVPGGRYAFTEYPGPDGPVRSPIVVQSIDTLSDGTVEMATVLERFKLIGVKTLRVRQLARDRDRLAFLDLEAPERRIVIARLTPQWLWAHFQYQFLDSPPPPPPDGTDVSLPFHILESMAHEALLDKAGR